MKIIDLKPREATVVLTRCCVTRSNVYYNDTPKTDKQCAFRGVIRIDKKHYCRKHAGIYLLNEATGDKQ